jgi:hypothetical protein
MLVESDLLDIGDDVLVHHGDERDPVSDRDPPNATEGRATLIAPNASSSNSSNTSIPTVAPTLAGPPKSRTGWPLAPSLWQFEADTVAAITQAIEIPLVDRNGSDRGLALAEKEREGIRSCDEEMDTARPTPDGSTYRAQQR